MSRQDDLEQRVTDLAVGVVGMHGALDGVAKALTDDVAALRIEINTQRKLSKYNRRTHFQMLFWVAFFAIHLSSAATLWEDTAPRLHDFIFWLEPGSTAWRLAGLAAQLFLFWFFWHRAQVPDELFHRVAAGAEAPPEKRSLYNRLLGRAS